MRSVYKYLLGISFLFAFVACLSAMSGDVAADTHTWDAGGGADTTFDQPLNWDNDAVPETIDDAVLSSGTITFDANAAIGSFDMTGGTLTGNPAYTLTCAGDFTQTAGTITNNVLKLDMSGTDKSLQTSCVFYTLTVSGSVTNLGVCSSYNLIVSGTFVLNVDYNCNWYDGFTFSNSGTVNGPGELTLRLYNADKIGSFGTMNAPLRLLLDGGAGASYDVNLENDDVLGGSIMIVSAHSTNVITLDLNGYDLSCDGVNVGVRGVLLGGEGTITNGGSWNSSAGTWNPETSRVVFDGNGTITMAAGQTFYDFEETVGTNISISGLVITHDLLPLLSFTSLAPSQAYQGAFLQYSPLTTMDAYGVTRSVAFDHANSLVYNATTNMIEGRLVYRDNIGVSIAVEDQYGRVVYQNFTMPVTVPLGDMTQQDSMTLFMFIVGLITSFVIAIFGLWSGRPIITMIAGLFGFVIITALMLNPVTSVYWWMVMIPLTEFLMFGLGMRR